jgi:endonuclease/exonuclease/phosphatase (EEP) superfamily protein YafD
LTETHTRTSGPAEPAPKQRKWRGRVECQLGLLLGIGGLVGSRLGHLWIAFDVFSQFTLQFAVVTFAFLAGLFMPRAKLLVAFLIVAAGLLAIGVWPHVAARTPHLASDVKAGERAVTVASFNTWYDNQKVEEVQAEIERLDADIITLIEFGPNKRVLLKKLANRYPYHAECFAVDYCHMVILAKFPIVKSEARVGWDGPPVIQANFGGELGNLTVIGVHTIRFPHSRAQFRQVQALAKFIEVIPSRKLVMGDFNATPFSRITQTIAAQTGLVRLTMLPTWPSRLQLPQVAIDHIFVSPGIRVIEDERIGNPAGSDHYPITMKLAVPVN